MDIRKCLKSEKRIQNFKYAVIATVFVGQDSRRKHIK